MNSDSPRTPREEMETWLTALLLGELSEGEAAAVRALMAHDADLAKLHDRLRQAIALVRETVPQMEAPSAPLEPLKLSEERRQRLLTCFKIPPLKIEHRKPRPWQQLRLIEVLGVIAAIALIAVMLLPSLGRTKSRAQRTSFYTLLSGKHLDVAEGVSAPPAAVRPPDSAAQEAMRLAMSELSLERGRAKAEAPEAKPAARIVLPDMVPSDSAYLAKGAAVTLAEESRSRLGERNGVLEQAQRQRSDKAFVGRGAYAEPATSAPGQPIPEADASLSRERQQEVLKYFDVVTGGPAQRATGGDSVLPTTGLPAESPTPSAGAGALTTPAAGEQAAFMRRYGLPAIQQPGGTGGMGGGGFASGGGTPPAPQATPSQAPPGQVVAGFAPSPVPVLGDLPVEGKLFRSEQPSSEIKLLGFSQRGPKPQTDQPAWDKTHDAGVTASTNYLALGAAFVPDNFRTADEAATVGWEKAKKTDRDWFAGNFQVPERGVMVQPAPPPVLLTEETAGRKSSSIILPPVAQDAAGAAVVEPTEAEVLARGGILPARPSRPVDSTSAGKPTGTRAPVRADELVVEDRLLKQSLIDSSATDQKPALSVRGEPSGTRVAQPKKLPEVRLALKKEPELRQLETAPTLDGASASNGIERVKVDERFPAVVPLEQVVTAVTPSAVSDLPVRKPSTNAPIPQPEIQTSENAFSTFSLNVSDVSFKLAAASLEKGQMPDPASVRSEEFINAFDYRDPEPPPGAPIAFAWERARYPFAHNRDLLRFSLKTAAAGRQAGRPLNLVLLLDNSGSMERADRVSIIREALRVLASQLQPQDKLSVITFARTARLVADGVAGDKAGEVTEQVSGLTPQGGTNLEEAMNLAYQTVLRHYLIGGINRVVLLTDGAANLGNVDPDSLKQKVEAHRRQGVALDCFGIGWEGFNDDLLEVLSRNGDGRYGFVNSPEEAATEFAGQLAGALRVAASDVKVQVEFNPRRVTSYRQIGYAKHQLTKEQFRDNTVDAAEIAAQEAGNALYTVEVNPAGEGPLGTVRVRYKIAGTLEYREHAWEVPYLGNAPALEQSSPAMRLAASASAFAEWLVASPFAAEVTPDRLLAYLGGVPEIYGADTRPKKLEWMIRQAKSMDAK